MNHKILIDNLRLDDSQLMSHMVNRTINMRIYLLEEVFENYMLYSFQ
jgi:hypothetical protein